MVTSLISFRDGVVLTILKQALFYMMPVITLGIASYVFGVQPLGPSTAGGVRIAELQMSPRERRRKRAAELEAVPPVLLRQQATGAGPLPSREMGET
jgi:hypothetical protein